MLPFVKGAFLLVKLFVYLIFFFTNYNIKIINLVWILNYYIEINMTH